MEDSICGVDCSKCGLKDSCNGCKNTNGHPFGGECVIACCCQNEGKEFCKKCLDMPCKLKEKLIEEINLLGIADMEKVTDLNALKGSFVNIEYTLSNGQIFKLLDDNKIYLGNQLSKEGTNRCYGIACDEKYILVCEYDAGGLNPEIVVYKRRKK